MTSLARFPRTLARMIAASVMAGALALAVCPPPAAAASGPVTTTTPFTADFQTSGQGMWGPGSPTSLGGASLDVIPTQAWNTSGSANNIVSTPSFDWDVDQNICADLVDSDCGNDNDESCSTLDNDTSFPNPFGSDYDIGNDTDNDPGADGQICADSNADPDSPSFSLDTDGDNASNDNDLISAQFGGNISGSTSGTIGVQLNVSGLSSGSIGVNYPISGSLTVTQPSQYVKPGDVVTISSNWSPQPGYGIATQSSMGTVGMSGDFAFAASASGTVCVVSCGSFSLFPSIHIPETQGTIIPSFGPGTSIPAFGPGVSGSIHAPSFGVSGTTIGADGRSLVATGTDDFWNVKLDLAKIISKMTGVPIASGTPTIDGVGFSYDLLTAVPNPDYQATQTLTFTPTVTETLHFPVPVAYTAYRHNGTQYGSGTSSSVTFPADGSVHITVPNVASGLLKFTSDLGMQGTLTNQSGFRLNWSLDLQALTASASFQTAGSFNLGPIEDYNTGPATLNIPVTGPGSQFGLDTGSWGLGGFSGIAGPSGSIVVDSVPPVTTGTLSGPQGSNGWFTGATTLHLSATDDASGVASTMWSRDGGQTFSVWPGTPQTFSSDGRYTLEYYSVDNAGNREQTHVLPLNIDQTPPSTTAQVVGTPGNDGWWKAGAATQLVLSATDNLSGVAATDYSVDNTTTGQITPPQVYSGPVTFTDGQYTVTYYSVDKAGNREAAQTISFNVDQTPPTTAPAVTGTTGTNGWFKQGQPVQLTLTANDNLSGVADTLYQVTDTTTGQTGAWQAYSAPVTFTDGVYTVSYYSVDKAGNPEGTHTVSFKVDQTAPGIAYAGRTPADSYGWNNGPVTVAWNCTDGLSGPVSPQVNQTVSTEGADQSTTGTCTDNAGNTSSDTQAGINIDLTPPVVTYTGNAGTYTVADTVDITCTATDALSGIASDTCADITGPAYSFGLGTHSYSAAAVDKAGNTASSTTSFNVTVSVDSLCALTGQFDTKAGVVQSLCAKLQNAAANAGKGNGHPTQNEIQAYENEVSAQTDKSLTSAQAQILVSLAQALAAQYP